MRNRTVAVLCLVAMLLAAAGVLVACDTQVAMSSVLPNSTVTSVRVESVAEGQDDVTLDSAYVDEFMSMFGSFTTQTGEAVGATTDTIVVEYASGAVVRFNAHRVVTFDSDGDVAVKIEFGDAGERVQPLYEFISAHSA